MRKHVTARSTGDNVNILRMRYRTLLQLSPGRKFLCVIGKKPSSKPREILPNRHTYAMLKPFRP